MSSAKLKYMGNQIVRNFAVMPHEEALEATRDHLLKFWNRVMRNRIFEELDRGEEGFDPLLVEALRGLKRN